MDGRKRVMVVDDEAIHRETLAIILEDYGIETVGFERAADALKVLSAGRKVDLVLSDVVMPDMDGLEFARRARKVRPEVPLVLVTGRDSALDSILADGSIALLKPYSSATLYTLLVQHLGPIA